MTAPGTETSFTSPRLERPHEAPLAGVCLALARTTGTDVVLWRVLFVVLTVFGGLGAALYLACYVTIPGEGQEHSLVARLLHGPDRTVTTKQVLLLGLVLVVAAAAFHGNGGAVVVVGLAALGLLWWHQRHPSGAPAPGHAGVGGGAEVAPQAVAAELPPYQSPAWSASPPSPRSVVAPLTLSVTALVVGVLLLVASAGHVSVPTEVVLAAALGTVGLGLVVSAFWGRARGLVPVAVLLALALGAAYGARPALEHGVGTRHWTAQATGATYRLGVGDATLVIGGRLSQGDAAKELDAEVTVGHLVIEVPAGIHVIVDAHVQNGDVQGPGGVDASGRRVSRGFELGPREAPPVYVHARVEVGMVEVRHA